MQSKAQSALLPITAVGYLGYLWVMGLLLITGGLGCLKRQTFGPAALSLFLLLYVLLFVNFMTINPKVFHLIACAIGLGLYLWLRKKELVATQAATIA